MKIPFSFVLLPALLPQVQGASMAIDFTRNNNSVATSYADYQANDANLETGGAFEQRSGTTAAPFSDLNSTTFGAFTVTASGQATSVSAAGAAAWTDNTPILEGYLYVDTNGLPGATPTITIAGLAALGAGQTATLTMYGIGDNIGQSSTLTVNYAGSPIFTGTTVYNGAGEARTSSTGSVPFLQTAFVTDGVTDEVSFVVSENGNRYFALNGFSLSVVPEPSSTALLALAGSALLLRRRKG
ncbi:PEP-CTERM sorting domain-containing protein [Roseibacillus ishigakijimensis]|uniref:PEP-CTERM sorting domain-containing protein n=1 Tax=Roseibacillus ishigakijimensis TaxID=454146 RepID=A0A934VLW0_9BACT|nr:PEP-CTERM sorting domain-containing protein [Roseibacillus ishigakijimensis]MBK1833491.1 PEP-CTERM sorting domain-containing protein [Roseibacillus ishigakijimensis]